MMAEDDDARGAVEGPGRRRPIPERPKQPLTIDLAATPGPEAAAASDTAAEGSRPHSGASQSPPGSRPGWLPLILAGVVGGVIATGLGILWHASGIVPTRSETLAGAAGIKADSAAVAVGALETRIAALEARPATPTAEIQALSQRVAAIESRPPAVGTPTLPAGLDARIAAVEAAAEQARTAAGEAREAAGTSRADAGVAIASADKRIAELTASVAALSARLNDLAATQAAATTAESDAKIAAIDLIRTAAQGGAPFPNEVQMLAALGADEAEIAALKPLADKGVPSTADLQWAFSGVANAILAATTGPAAAADGSLVGRLADYGRGLVSIRPTAVMTGNTPEAVVSRMQAAVDAGNLAGALTERDTLPEAGKAASATWAAAVLDRITLDGLIATLTAMPPAK